jgi:predicted nucleotidyltransferase
MSVLTEAQERAATRALDQESAARRHVVVSLSGAHAYGFPSPDSDVDLKAIHVTPTARLVGLDPPPLHADRLEVLDGVEIDYTSNELGGVLASILGGNGNYVERVLGALSLRSSPEHAELRPLVAAGLSRRLHRHYFGFARGQLQQLDAMPQPTAKRMLYVLRTALTGLHLLTTGRLVIDVRELLDDYGFAAAAALVERKRAGERIGLEEGEKTRWRGELVRALELLEHAPERSPLPEESPNRAELEAWLVEVRRRLW